MSLLNKLFDHPLTKGLSLDDPGTTNLRRNIILQKDFLCCIYIEWYQGIKEALASGNFNLELGSGAGFMANFIPDLITSEVMDTSGVDLITDACALPFGANTLDNIVMTDVFHHIPNVNLFLDETSRCLRIGGKLIMIEPWVTSWSKFIYTKFHHEPFLVDANWELPKGGALSMANGALPWIVFKRDNQIFSERYPTLRLNRIDPLMPISYLLSGGISKRSLLMGSFYKYVRRLERDFLGEKGSMFAFIEVERVK